MNQKYDARRPIDKGNMNFENVLAIEIPQAEGRERLEKIRLRKMLYQAHMNFVIRRTLIEKVWLSTNCRTFSAEDYTIAFVWELDDITMLSRERLAEISQIEPDTDFMSFHRLIDSVLMSMDIAHPDEIAARYVMNIEDALYDQPYSPRYYILKNLYKEIVDRDGGEDSIISHALLEKCGMSGEEVELCRIASKLQEIRNERWKNVKKSLSLVNMKTDQSRSNKYANVVISNEGVAQAAIEILISGYSSEIAIENIYTSLGNMQYLAWNRIRRRFGEHCRLVYITSRSRPSLPQMMGIRVFPINADDCIDFIYNSQLKSLK